MMRFSFLLGLAVSGHKSFFSTALSSSSPFGSTAKNVATQILQGAGPATVDLNQYNLPLEEIEQEWKAELVQKVTETTTKVALSAKSPEHFVDTVVVRFPRRPHQGLGVELVELAGGRADGLGITLISNIVENGAASGQDILPGDSIGRVRLIRSARGAAAEDATDGTKLAEEITEFVAQTECLGYDATVDVLSSLPDFSENDIFQVELKRLRRKPKVKVNLQYPPSQNEEDVTLELFSGENLRQGMLIRGVKLNDPLAKRFDTKNGGNCGAGGLCRTCAVSIPMGVDLLNEQRPAEKQMLADNPRWRLACKAIVGFGMQEGEMTVRVNPRQW